MKKLSYVFLIALSVSAASADCQWSCRVDQFCPGSSSANPIYGYGKTSNEANQNAFSACSATPGCHCVYYSCDYPPSCLNEESKENH
jgi:hypothetical protein